MTRKKGSNPCETGHGFPKYTLEDARGIPVGIVCHRCEDFVKARYRPEVFTDASYEADEPIEAD